MAYKKGESGNPKGRKKGTANKTTNDMRLMFQTLFDANFDNLQLWFDKVGKENPQQAISLFLKLSKFIVPELQNIKIEDNQSTVINWHETKTFENPLSEVTPLTFFKTDENKNNQ